MKKVNILIVLIFIFISDIFPSAIVDEYELKAAYLEKFARFIEWSSIQGTSGKDDFFEIVILGDNPFSTKLDNLYSKQKIKERPVKIRYIKSLNEIGDCHILYICPSMSSSLLKVLNKVKNKNILTIGQTDGFCEKGVHINFYISASKLKFYINDKSARSSNLKISHLLLQTATIINTTGGNNE